MFEKIPLNKLYVANFVDETLEFVYIGLSKKVSVIHHFDVIREKSIFVIVENQENESIGYMSLVDYKIYYPIKSSLKDYEVICDEDDIVKSQSVDILKRRERTAIGLKGKYLYIVIFTKDFKVDANEMREYLLDELKLQKAMALDGGLSTSLNYRDISIGSLGKYQRRVKSFLVIER